MARFGSAGVAVLKKWRNHMMPRTTMDRETPKPRRRIPDRIDVKRPIEIKRWADRLGVSEYHLRWTVNKVGPMARDVAQDLGKLL
jgi:hypothetical protein